MAVNELEFKFEDFVPGLITLCEGESPTVECVARSLSICSLELIGGLV